MDLAEPPVLRSTEEEQDWIGRAIQAGLERPRLALVHYDRCAVIYGRSTVPAADVRDRAREAGCTVLQRRSGGGAVLAGPWMLGAALLVPPAAPLGRLGIAAAFRAFGGAWRHALGALGAACHEPDADRIARHNRMVAELGVNWVCFSGLSHGELVDAQDCKVLGLAQWRGNWGVLLSAGILLQPVPWQLLGRVHLGMGQWEPGHAVTAGVGLDGGALGQELLHVLRGVAIA